MNVQTVGAGALCKSMLPVVKNPNVIHFQLLMLQQDGETLPCPIFRCGLHGSLMSLDRQVVDF